MISLELRQPGKAEVLGIPCLPLAPGAAGGGQGLGCASEHKKEKKKILKIHAQKQKFYLFPQNLGQQVFPPSVEG